PRLYGCGGLRAPPAVFPSRKMRIAPPASFGAGGAILSSRGPWVRLRHRARPGAPAPVPTAIAVDPPEPRHRPRPAHVSREGARVLRPAGAGERRMGWLRDSVEGRFHFGRSGQGAETRTRAADVAAG